MSMRINKAFDYSLTANTSLYRTFVKTITSAINKSYSNLPNYSQGSVEVIRFRPGSIIADYVIKAKSNTLDFTSANTQLSAALLEEEIPLTLDAFAESVDKNLTTKDKFYPYQNVEMRCTRPDSVEGEMKWTVNEDPVQNSVKYDITYDASGSTLIVNNASESDNGRYSCIIGRPTLPYIQWQRFVLQPRPNIIVDKTNIKLSCEDPTVSLKCCADGYSVEWDPILPGDEEIPASEIGCMTLKHKILKSNCGSKKSFICRLKNMKELETFDYYNSTGIQVQTANVFDCENETLGVGKIGDNVTGECEKGLEGRITYQCQQVNSQKKWTETQRDCVVEAIKDLERKVENLVVEDIPEFMADLSDAANQNNVDITQSADTVQTIVDILVKIASISQNITISQPVMEDFLKTVDIIMSDQSIETWAELNSHSTTENKSIELLQAIENISDHLSDDNFEIRNSSFHLNRTTIQNSFISSQLSNSTTEIMIPNVSKPTLITIIVFTKLDNVLPTRNTSNNDSRKLDNRINGDVVVIKVNETINNISFTFDITNESLKNPQCVFWNFDVNHWDSTGCKFKLLGNETNKVTCECDHTTSFSILMSPFAIDDTALDYITYIGVAISMASLILCLIIEIIVWKLMTRNDLSYMRHVSIVNIAVSLLIANICFIIGAAVAEQEPPNLVDRCSPVVFFMHFFYLAVFFWMFISALLLFYHTVMVFSQLSRTSMMVFAFVVGYCAPLLIAVITVASTAGPKNYVSKKNENVQKTTCWLNWYESKALLGFVIPALTIVAFNLLVLVVVVYKMLRRGVGATTQTDERHVLMVIARCIAILTPLFGLTWGFGIGTMMTQNRGIHVVFTVLNSLQGFFVLLFGLLFDSKIREALAGRLSLRTLTSSNRTRSTSAGPSSGGLEFLRRMRRRNVYHVSEVAASSGITSNSSSASESLMNP